MWPTHRSPRSVPRAAGRVPGVLVALLMTACEYTGHMGHLSTCTSDSCGSQGAVLWGVLPFSPGEEASFLVSLERNGRSFPDKSVSAGPSSECDRGGDYAACLSIRSPGEFCGPDLSKVEGGAPVVCIGVAVDGPQFPLENGDRYHLVVKDGAGDVLVDEHWTAAYTDQEPFSCVNTNNLICRWGYHRFTPR